MKAVVFKGVQDVAVEERPMPLIQDPLDVVVKVQYTALCGSELHVYRGHQPSKPGFIMGHEFTGVVSRVGSAVRNLRPGDTVVSPFTISCGECFYCTRGFSSRCEKCLLFGCPLLDGGQAEYVRVPLADATVMKVPPGIGDPKLCLLMADILPTGLFAAANAFANRASPGTMTSTATSTSTPRDEAGEGEDVVVLIGCGPVGLCALLAALEWKPKALLAVDSVESRLNQAKELGAEPWNYQTQREGLERRVKELTDGRGADAIIEVVGHSSALDMGFSLLRPWGVISSVGVHNGQIPWTGNQAYGKNLTIRMGRCPVRSMAVRPFLFMVVFKEGEEKKEKEKIILANLTASHLGIFPKALELLERKQQELKFMVDTIVPLSDAVRGYQLFNEMKALKVIFDAEK